ncbi:MAG: SnoaL-like domain-containing protein [Chloroflexi bacterium]|nr:SnoaL-like domain-containing protein [Chloroflexota bacterium]
MKRWGATGMLVALTALAGCGGQNGAAHQQAIRDLVAREAQAVVAQDLDVLMELWASTAVVTDAGFTPNDASDDLVWRGDDALRDRYIFEVFPGGAAAAGPTELEVEVQGDRATARSTTRVGSEVSPGGDRWTFVRRDGRWLIQSLTYNLEAPPTP